MFLFEPIPWYSILMWFIVVAFLILVNEIARRSKWFSLFLFLLLPIMLAFAVWPKTVEKDSEIGTWFDWLKVYSALLSCLGFLAMRFIKGLITNKYILMFPAIALVLNILLAVMVDFQVYPLNGNVNGVMRIGGPWNIMNGIAGIFNMVTISGWVGIFNSKDKYKDLIWPDQMWFWIIAYNLWNFAFVYNCITDHAFYSGAALLISSVIPAFLIKKGAWLQHRAQTLAIWMLFVMSYPAFVSDSIFAVQSSHSIAALLFISSLSLISNLAVLVYHLYKIIKHMRNPLKEEVYIDLAGYKKIVELHSSAKGK
ncbi:DUF5692 family protein [Bacillus sp. MRMR6]|uniref:DUF5692 family protein n=1 Tax=Bacillus sp. MRMR6 TaxID=1928617 RepID=UPI0009534134|nr:DUF5692 family protein [Bacillus sp. MRMR6]OLS40931.1 hypothetical protein BTR25_06270 [Bacillus sp. MRMR6]